MRLNKTITAAESIGTIIYRITGKQLTDYYADDPNVVMRTIVDELGFDAFDTDNMWGSYYDAGEDTFYYCRTDGQPITVNGEEIEPEYALEEYSPEELSEYIQDATDTEIKNYFSTYELANIDLNDIAYTIITDGYPFTSMIEDMNKLDLLDNLL